MARFRRDDVQPIGKGGYLKSRPTQAQAPPATIYRARHLTGPMPSNRWWSSVACTPFSDSFYAHPLAFKATPQGFEVSFPVISVADDPPAFHAYHHPDLVIGLSNVQFSEALVSGFTDWTVDVMLQAGQGGNPGRDRPNDGDDDLSHGAMTVRVGHGFPFVYVTKPGKDPIVTWKSAPRVWSRSGSVMALTVDDRHYALFAPKGSRWVESESGLTWALTGQPAYFSLAVLPDESKNTLRMFAAHAFAFPVDTRVDWDVELERGQVHTTFSIETEVKQGLESRPLIALYPHQWKATDAPLTPWQYESPRGAMKVIRQNTFTTVHTYHGILPFMPDVGNIDRDQLTNYVQSASDASTFWRLGMGADRFDTYLIGKSLNRLAQLVPIADQLGLDEARERLLQALKSKLEQWLDPIRPSSTDASADATDRSVDTTDASSETTDPNANTTDPATERDQLFYYDSTWGTLFGHPTSHGAATDLNDHHFHYGYYVHAAAMVALYDPAWADHDAWGGMIRHLAKDFACPHREDSLFPFLRNFDPYAGHSWASGTASAPEGNNQESSSEAIHAWAGLVLWGEATGDHKMRDLGIWGYTLESEAALTYWFDVDRDVFPPGYQQSTIARLFSSGGDYNTWWTTSPIAVHAINYLPITGASLYLGRDPQYVNKNLDELLNQTGGRLTHWVDLIASYQAFYDPESAIKRWSEGPSPEFGETTAHTMHWIGALSDLGRVHPHVTSNAALAAVFYKEDTHEGGQMAYVAYNVGDEPMTVAFSDGSTMTVSPRSMRVEKRNFK